MFIILAQEVFHMQYVFQIQSMLLSLPSTIKQEH
jgi:hypothetical protein